MNMNLLGLNGSRVNKNNDYQMKWSWCVVWLDFLAWNKNIFAPKPRAGWPLFEVAVTRGILHLHSPGSFGQRCVTVALVLAVGVSLGVHGVPLQGVNVSGLTDFVRMYFPVMNNYTGVHLSPCSDTHTHLIQLHLPSVIHAQTALVLMLEEKAFINPTVGKFA